MASRKLTSEIERTLKKIGEGVEVFSALFEKLLLAPTQTLKEKLEVELKKELKKLQRFRDQIKTWASSPEIKDKKPLLENRRLIETQMERFKAMERELKTKAYSSAGLNAASKMDPEDEKKEEIRMWLSDMGDKLSAQVDMLEAEQEQQRIASKKSKRIDPAKAERALKVDVGIERHKHHQTRLEIILRMLDNGNLAPDLINAIREDVTYYVDENHDPDFEEDQGLYDELNLEEYGFGNEDEESDADSVEEISPKEEVFDPLNQSKDRKNSKSEEQESAQKFAITKERELVAQENLRKSIPGKDREKDGTAAKPKISSLPPPRAPVVPKTVHVEPAVMPQRYASAAAAVTAVKVLDQPKSTLSSKHTSAEITANILTQIPQASASSTVFVKPKFQQSDGTTSSAPQPSFAAMNTSFANMTVKQKPLVPKTSPQPDLILDEAPPAFEVDSIIAPILADLIASFESAKSGSLKSHESSDRMLEASLLHLPEAVDSSRANSYIPYSPYSVPSYYPQMPLPLFEVSTVIFERLDIDTLFYIFYFRQGTYQQYLAGKELKRQSWRFHKKFMTWFQRHDEPVSITEEYEEGAYIYFDYEQDWCQRKKQEFRFEYRYLEDEV